MKTIGGRVFDFCPSQVRTKSRPPGASTNTSREFTRPSAPGRIHAFTDPLSGVKDTRSSSDPLPAGDDGDLISDEPRDTFDLRIRE